MYHYTTSGLDNVWLQNGYTVKQTAYGEAVSVADADSLHEMLALRLTEKPGRLNGKEFRFLRTMMYMSQEGMAKMMGVTDQALSLWERTGKIPKSGDAVARMLILEKLAGDGKMSKIIDRVNTVERICNQQIVARARSHKWTTTAKNVAPVPGEKEVETA